MAMWRQARSRAEGRRDSNERVGSARETRPTVHTSADAMGQHRRPHRVTTSTLPLLIIALCIDWRLVSTELASGSCIRRDDAHEASCVASARWTPLIEDGGMMERQSERKGRDGRRHVTRGQNVSSTYGEREGRASQAWVHQLGGDSVARIATERGHIGHWAKAQTYWVAFKCDWCEHCKRHSEVGTLAQDVWARWSLANFMSRVFRAGNNLIVNGT